MRKEQISNIVKDKRLKKKLVLNKETIRELKDSEMKIVAGGEKTSTIILICTSASKNPMCTYDC